MRICVRPFVGRSLRKHVVTTRSVHLDIAGSCLKAMHGLRDASAASGKTIASDMQNPGYIGWSFLSVPVLL